MKGFDHRDQPLSVKRIAEKAIADPALDRLVVTDAVPAFRLDSEAAREKIEVLPVAPLLAEILRRLHAGGTLLDLLAL